jgi:hypothetical protein
VAFAPVPLKKFWEDFHDQADWVFFNRREQNPPEWKEDEVHQEVLCKLGRNFMRTTHLATLNVRFAYNLMIPAGGSRSYALPDQTRL